MNNITSRVPVTEYISKEYITAALYETLRLCPPIPRLGRQALSGVHIKARRFTTSHDGKVRDMEEYTVLIKGGSLVVIDISALHMNREVRLTKIAKFLTLHSAIYWGDDVTEFKPERFIDRHVPLATRRLFVS